MDRSYSVTISSGIRLYVIISDVNPTPGLLWTEIETDVAIVCACLPTMMPLFRLVQEKLASKFTLLYVYSKDVRVFKPQDPRSKISEPALATNRDGFIHLADGVELSTATPRAWKGPLPDNEAPRLIEGHAMGKVYVREDVDVLRDQI